MNQVQLKYARERANDIYQRRCASIRTKYTEPEVVLTPAQKTKALKDGKFKVKDTISTYSHYLEDYVILEGVKPLTRDEVKIKAETDALAKEYRKVTDELVLGDQEEALKLIKAFDKE